MSNGMIQLTVENEQSVQIVRNGREVRGPAYEVLEGDQAIPIDSLEK